MLADLTRAWIPITLDRERVLCFDNRATWLLMERYGIEIFTALYEKDTSQPSGVRIRSMETLEYFLWVGLQRDADDAGETLTLEQVQEFITPLSVKAIFAALLRALYRPLHRKNAETVGETGAPAAGKRSPRRSTGKPHYDSLAEGSD